MSKTPDGAVDHASMEAQALDNGLIDASGFFTPQPDWEFELDTMQDTSRAALEAHLAKAGADNSETAAFLKAYLMSGTRVAFTPFED
jgi:hypothetical protein